MGLVNQVPTAELEAYVRDYAGRIGANAPLSIAAVKCCVDEYLKDPAERDLAACQAAVDACARSPTTSRGERRSWRSASRSSAASRSSPRDGPLPALDTGDARGRRRADGPQRDAAPADRDARHRRGTVRFLYGLPFAALFLLIVLAVSGDVFPGPAAASSVSSSWGR